MNKTLEALAKRRASLVEQSKQQRLKVIACAAPLGKPLAIADKGIVMLQYLRTHPLFWLGSGLLYAGFHVKLARSWSQKARLALGLFSKTRQLIKKVNTDFSTK